MTELENTVDPKVITAATDAVITALIKSGSIKVPKPARKKVSWERLLVYEYANTFYPENPKWFRIEVGPIPGKNGDMLYARMRRWADCIIIEDDHILLIEGKMRARVEVVSQLQTYKTLLPQTPMFRKYYPLPIKMRLVTAMIDEETRKFVESAGIEVEVFKPSNYDEWYKFKILQQAE